jgi:hypothetical protein
MRLRIDEFYSTFFVFFCFQPSADCNELIVDGQVLSDRLRTSGSIHGGKYEICPHCY